MLSEAPTPTRAPDDQFRNMQDRLNYVRHTHAHIHSISWVGVGGSYSIDETRRHRLGTDYCTPDIDTSEIIVDCQWHFPMDYQRCFPTDLNLSVVCSKGLSLSRWISAGNRLYTIYLCDFWRVIFRPEWPSRASLQATATSPINIIMIINMIIIIISSSNNSKCNGNNVMVITE